MNKIKNIAVFTSIRSEYGLLYPLLKEINTCKDFKLFLLVGGAHLKHNFGHTIDTIIEDGFEIIKTFDFLDDVPTYDFSTRALSKLQIEIGEYFSKNKFDLILFLGDRYELIPVAISALLYHIPIAHISGGDSTEGAIDNQIRHALTKMSHLHFPATQKYGENIAKMGEEDWRICVSGEPGLDEILDMTFVQKDILFNELGLDINKKTICFTMHPQTIDGRVTHLFIRELLSKIEVNTKFQILATASNFDNGGHEINEELISLSLKLKRVKYFSSLGQKRYYSLLKYADLVLGNSSSGIVEAQSFMIPVVNIGDRQQGRLLNPNVVNVNLDINKILEAISFSQSGMHRKTFINHPNIYGDGKASKRIVDFIKNVDKDKLLKKIDNF